MLFFSMLIALEVDTIVQKFQQYDFKVDFYETVYYKNTNIVDTFQGTIKKVSDKMEMNITTPYKGKYEIFGDTLLSIVDGDSSFFPLEEDATKLLDFSFLGDTTSLIIQIEGNRMELKPRGDSWFNYIKLLEKEELPVTLEVDDNEKVTKFYFNNWRFYERKTRK